MQYVASLRSLGAVFGVGAALLACSSGDKGNAGSTMSNNMAGAQNVAGAAAMGGGAGGGAPAGGSGNPVGGSGGVPTLGAGGSQVIVGAGGSQPMGGATSMGGTAPMGGATSMGGAAPMGGATSMGGAPATMCTSMSPVGATTFGMFPAGDPSKKGTFAVTTTNNTGPMNSYTLFRPTDLTKGGPLFPVVTWGNGTGTTPSVYSFLLTALASHGFIVIASNSMNVGQGTPPPMLDGVTWVFQQNCDPMSPLYQHVDTAHVGATGHSQGAFATMTAGADPRIVATAPIEGSVSAKLHGPSLLLCGAMDTTVGCKGAQTAFGSITGVPLMYAELQPADHTNWISASITAQFGGGAPSPFVTAVVGWMRVFLMNDQSLKPMFFGPTCTLCQDTTNWKIQQKMLD
jgi:hypothetical protein